MSCTLAEARGFNVQLDGAHGSLDDPAAHSKRELIELAARLGRLASQHQWSEYNRSKYGPNGCPVSYFPMSTHAAEYFEKLLQHQTRYVDLQAWWLADGQVIDLPVESVQHRMNRPTSAMNLQEDLQSAMSSLLIPQTTPTAPPTDSTNPRPKTSVTHPLNISIIIPLEKFPIISANLSRAPTPSPVMFNIPPSINLYRLVCRPPPPHSLPSIPADTTPQPLPPRNDTSAKLPGDVIARTVSQSSSLINLLWNQTFIRKAVVSAVCGFKSSSGKQASYTVTISAAVPEVSVPGPNRPRPRSLIGTSGSSERDLLSDAHKISGHLNPLEKIRDDASLSAELYGYAVVPSADEATGDYSRVSSAPNSPPRSLRIGNLFLSSCPGKKVRLSGPVNGRSGVNRDVRLDLQRIRDLGVRCIVCCLDDDELAFLGSPWETYCTTAYELGIDILRLPMPEGLAPADVAIFDSHLSRLINDYTLKGIPVLAHCRGGVGRAGLVACCWLIKLGLCGWADAEPAPRPKRTYEPPKILGSPMLTEKKLRPFPVRRDTLMLLERVIALVRKQRSLKAVETFEQVKFLVEFIDYIRNKTAVGASSTHALRS